MPHFQNFYLNVNTENKLGGTMESYKYEIFILGEYGRDLAATCKELDIALIIAKGIMSEYYAEPNFEVSIKRSQEDRAKLL